MKYSLCTVVTEFFRNINRATSIKDIFVVLYRVVLYLLSQVFKTGKIFNFTQITDINLAKRMASRHMLEIVEKGYLDLESDNIATDDIPMYNTLSYIMDVQPKVILDEKGNKNYAPAKGILRVEQLNNLMFLQLFERLCDEAGVRFWLDTGQLLGAVRHLGFVPWDDDVDVGMLFDDVIKLICFIDNSKNIKYKVNYLAQNGYLSFQIRFYGLSSRIYIDIFPYVLIEDYSVDTQDLIREMFEENSKRQSLTQRKNYSNWKTVVGNINEKINRGSDFKYLIPLYYLGVKYRLYHEYSSVYPLQKMIFEGRRFNAPYNSDNYLIVCYGKDYMNPVIKDLHFSLNKRKILKDRAFLENLLEIM